MAKKSASKYALLGLLSWEPMSGYDIKKHFDIFLKFFWSESYGNIYPTLKGLLKKELVTSEVERTPGKPNRIVYTITQKGRMELIAWYHHPVPPPRIRSELLLRLYFGEQLPLTVHTGMIRELHDELRKSQPLIEKNETYYREISRNSRRDFLTYLTFRQGYHFFYARLKWCEEVLGILDEDQTFKE